MMAPSTGSGRLRKTPEKNSSVRATAPEVTTSDSGDLAPPMSLTAVCDMPPETGKPCTSEVAMLAAPSAVSSRSGSIS
jgi:hypothetical protein